MKCFSFFKVGGGFNAQDYATIRQQTDGKWNKWDAKSPPSEFVELAGSNQEKERPDVWIKPEDSIVIEVKAASVGVSESFRTKFTLRFPRFKRLRPDKDWKSALSIEEFMDIKAKVEEGKEDEFKVDKKKRNAKRQKREKVIAGTEDDGKAVYEGPNTGVFKGLNFCVLSEMIHPVKKTKAEVETIIKNNGGEIYQSATAKEEIIVIADKRVVKVASLIKTGRFNIVKPEWILHAVSSMEADAKLGKPRFVLPFEMRHMLSVKEDDRGGIEESTDQYGDSYCRETTTEELREVFNSMGNTGGLGNIVKHGTKLLEEKSKKLMELKGEKWDRERFLEEMHEKLGLDDMKGFLFRKCRGMFLLGGTGFDVDTDTRIAMNHFGFGNGVILSESEDNIKTHVKEAGATHVIFADKTEGMVQEVKKLLGGNLPHLVSWRWIRDSWDQETRLDESQYIIKV